MRNFSINYKDLDKKINVKSYPYDAVKNKITKIAFDVVKFNDADGIDGLWKIDTSPDGEVIVALYDESIQKSASVKNNWQIITNSDKSELSFFYKNEPIVQASAKTLGLDADIDDVINWLPNKISENFSLRASILKLASDKNLMEKFPELYEDK